MANKFYIGLNMTAIGKVTTIITTFALSGFVMYTLASQKSEHTNLVPEKPKVAVTTFALYDIVKHVTGDSLQIVNILPFGVDPHDYEPTPKLMANIEKSALVIYSGAGLEPWTHGFSFKHKVLNMSHYVHLREFASAHHHKHSSQENELLDPHYWLNFKNMQNATKKITDELVALFPKNEHLYKKNMSLYLLMLQNLDTKYTQGLERCSLDTIITNHNAFGYLGDKYNFNIESVSGISPDAQTNAKTIIHLIREIQEHNVSTIFFESFASDKAIRNIAKQTKIAVDVLEPLGNITADEAKRKVTYEIMMQENLVKLSKALHCQ